MLPQISYEELKNLYSEFKKNPPLQEFNRWLEEFRYSADLLEFAKKANLKEDIVEFTKAKKIAIKNLKKFGFKG